MGFLIQTVGGLVLGSAPTLWDAQLKIRELVVVVPDESGIDEGAWAMSELLRKHRAAETDGRRLNVLRGRIRKGLIRDWDDRGWLDGEPRRGGLRRISINGTRHSMISIRLDHYDILTLLDQQ